MLRWLHREARWLAMADAGAIMRDHGAEAYYEARERERDVIRTSKTPCAS